MYKHYETSDDVFVDREEHIDWMNDALEKCKKEAVVLHLKGIGGIGKSSLLNHWMNTHDKTIRLDCEQYNEFYQRLNILAKGAVLQGIKLMRFDILWQIRQRFVEGVEPVREEGREWAKEVVMAIPFIGSLASIGSAINAVGAKVTPKLKGKYGTIGKWLQENLGKNHVEQLLEILWKDPRRAEFLYLSAFLEDINTRDDSDKPIIFLLDHFEYVDNVKAQWKYQKQKINETQLWTIFLSNLTNCVGVLASRRSATKSEEFVVEESELTELDRESCLEMMDLQGVQGETLQQTIVSVSGGNPFVIDAICDMINASDVSIEDLEDLRADTLSEVRLKVWRRLFREAEGLHKLINRAGIVPYFNERIMRIIAPEMTPDGWDRLRRLSFVNVRSDDTFVLHDLAEDLVHAELGDNLGNVVDEVSDLLEKKYKEESDITLLGLAISVRALKEPKKILTEFSDIASYNFSFRNRYLDGIALCSSIVFRNEEGEAYLKKEKAHYLIHADRIADGEHEIREAIEEFESLSGITEIERKRYLALSLRTLSSLFMRVNRDVEANNAFEEAITLAQEVVNAPPEHLPPGRTNFELSHCLWWYGLHLFYTYRNRRAEEVLKEAIQQWEKWKSQVSDLESHPEESMLLLMQMSLCNVWISAGRLSKAETRIKDLQEDVQQPHTIGFSYNMLCIICIQLNRPFEALEWAEKAMKIFNQMPEHVRAFVGSHTNFARSLHNLGRYSDALLKIEDVIQIAREHMEIAPEVYYDQVVDGQRTKAVLLRQVGKPEESKETCTEALRSIEDLAFIDPMIKESQIAWILNNRGVLLHKTGKTLKAMKDYTKGLDLGKRVAETSPDVVDHIACVAIIQNNLGNLYLATDRIKEAGEAYKESLALCKQLSELSVEMVQRERATVLNNQSALMISQGEYSDAEKKLKKSLSIRKELEENGVAYHLTPVGSTLNNLGLIHYRRGEYAEALDLFQEATAKLEEISLKSSFDCKEDLRCTLSNQYITLLKIEADTKKSDDIMKRLRALGVKKVESERWILDEMEFN